MRDVATTLRIELYHSYREAKKYDEAEKLYRTITSDEDSAKLEDPASLDLRYSFAEMLMSQKKYEEAEPISRAVCFKRRDAPQSEEFRMSHRQLCSILVKLKKYVEAENMQRPIYSLEPKNPWALENGDAACMTIAAQGQYDQAQLLQNDVWQARQKHDGQRHEFTVRSGMQRIAFLETLVRISQGPGASDAEKELSSWSKKKSEKEIEVMLEETWSTKRYPEPIPKILDAGHKLGSIKFRQGKFGESRDVLNHVWRDKKTLFGDDDLHTTDTGSMLGKALLRQNDPEDLRRAATILQGVWSTRRAKLGDDHADTLSSGEDLAEAHSLLADWRQAANINRWIVDIRTRHHGWRASKTVNSRWNLGQALFKQGNDREAEIFLAAVYNEWSPLAPHSKETLKCGHMLAELLEVQAEKTDHALQLSRDLFHRREASAERGSDHLDSGRLYSWMLLKGAGFEEAERVLKGLWEVEPKEPKEGEMRLRCGHLYGHVLCKRQKYSEAKDVLEVVTSAPGPIYPTDIEQLGDPSTLLKEADDRCKEMEKEKEKRNRRRRSPKFKW